MRGGTLTEEDGTGRKREIDTKIDMRGAETVTETGTGIGTETEAERGSAATGTEAAAGSGGGAADRQTGLDTT